MTIAAVSISPVGAGTSVSRHVAAALRVARQQTRVRVRLDPMFTTLEGDTQDIFDLDTPTPRDVAELPEAVERLAFGVSGGRVELGIFVDGGAA